MNKLSKSFIFSIFCLLITASSYALISFTVSSYFGSIIFDNELAEFSSLFQAFISFTGFIVSWLSLILVIDLLTYVIINKRGFKRLFERWTPITLVILAVNVIGYFDIVNMLKNISIDLNQIEYSIKNQWDTFWLRLIDLMVYGIVLIWGAKVISEIYDSEISTSLLIVSIPPLLILFFSFLF